MLFVLYGVIAVIAALLLSIKMPEWLAFDYITPDAITKIFGTFVGVVLGALWPIPLIVGVFYLLAEVIQRKLLPK